MRHVRECTLSAESSGETREFNNINWTADREMKYSSHKSFNGNQRGGASDFYFAFVCIFLNAVEYQATGNEDLQFDDSRLLKREENECF